MLKKNTSFPLTFGFRYRNFTDVLTFIKSKSWKQENYFSHYF